MSGSILIIDDEKGQRDILTAILTKMGYKIFSASGGEEALQQLQHAEFDLLLTDLKMQGISGMELMERVLADNPSQCVVMMTAHGTIDSAVEAMKKGAFDYLEKPLEREDLILTVQRAFERIGLLKENKALHKKLAETKRLPNMIGEHPKMHEVVRIINKIAPTSTTVLIYGESGTGKELVARAIHDGSPRRDKAFFAINCAAIPDSLMESELFGHEKGSFTGASGRKKGLFEEAHRGTIFLDEIGEMDMAMQVKLLRVLQERTIRRVGAVKDIEIDARVIAATNRDLARRIDEKSFREDLFYRLNVFPINIPPLRERPADIAALAAYFVDSFSRSFGRDFRDVSPEAEQLMAQYAWPGNVRELRNVIERICIMRSGPTLLPEHLPQEIRSSVAAHPLPVEMPNIVASDMGLEEAVSAVEKSLIQQALQKTGWNVLQTAANLKIPRGTLRYKMEKYNLMQ